MELSSDKLELFRSQAREVLSNEEHNEAITAICEANGWTREEFCNNRHEFRELELFLLQFGPSIPQLKYFPFLQTLKLNHVGLTEIKHMESLTSLEVLWMCENDIVRIEGLENCLNLRELYLHNNAIKRMSGLKRLKNLQVLWLSRNRIGAIEELEHLPELRSLWIAGNGITTLRQVFVGGGARLQELNVAANKITSFRDIPVLNELKALETLYFSDPQFGENPVCQLSNYQTFTLFHLPQVRTLDYVHISPEQRQLAESTFVKKKIYYSMRIHTIQRNLGVLQASVNNVGSKRVMEAETSMAVLELLSNNLLQDVNEFATYRTTSAPDKALRTEDAVARARSVLERVDKAIQSRRREIELVEKRRCEAAQGMSAATDTHISRLLLELNTGGNVRLEEGKVKEVWFQSCGELLRTRFFSSDFEPFGVKDIHIAKVTRIHNRGLRSRFDQTLGGLVDLSDPSYKRALEYLFYALPLDGDASVNEAIEHGFSVSKGTGVPMTNSVFLAEQSRLVRARAAAAASNRGASALSSSPVILSGCIVVCKVFLGKCVAEKTAGVVGAGEETLVSASPLVQKADYAASTANSVYRCKPQDPKQRIWYCFESELVLPEYLVDFTYTPTDICVTPPPMAQFGAQHTEEVLHHFKHLYPNSTATDLADFRAIGAHCLSFLQWSETSPLSAIATKDAAAVLAEPVAFSARQPVGGELHDVHAQNVADVLLGEDRDSVAAALKYLDLHSLKVSAVLLSPKFVTAVLTNLTELVLCDNELSSFPWAQFTDCKALEAIDLSNNQIKRLSEMAGVTLGALRKLHLQRNLLFQLDDVKLLGLAAPKLSELSLSQNPLLAEKRALLFTASHLPKLEILSHVRIDPHSEMGLHRLSPRLLDGPTLGFVLPTADQLSGGAISGEGAVVDPSKFFPCFDDAVAQYQAFRREHDCVPPLPIVSTVSQIPPPQVLAMNRTQIETLDALDRLRRVGHLQLRHNYIADMEPLCALSLLETLDLRDNRIRRIRGLAALTRLRRVDLTENYIDRIEGLETLKSLQFLALSYNRLTTLAPLASNTTLLELYCSGNLIATEKDALHLRDLPKLIILDLAGNPCVHVEAYRPYVVFQVKRLKVLDGISIDANEIQLSRDTFAGRISVELLKERLPPGMEWHVAKELNLASCALKEVTMLDSFSSLTHLKLEHNQLGNIDGLRPCTSLVALNLSHNKLGQCAVGRVFEAMPNLESLSLEANGIQSLANLQLNCPRLKFLNVKANEILKVDGLERVGQLREILLDKNRLRAIERDALLFVPYLRELYCEENAIKTIEGIHACVQLQKASFSSNRINEVSDIGKCLEGLPIVEICFLGNPVVRKAFYRNHLIHSLPNAQVIDNRIVTADERERVESSYQQDTIPPNVFTDVRVQLMPQGSMVPMPPSVKVPLKLVSLEPEASLGVAGGGAPGGRGRPPQIGFTKGVSPQSGAVGAAPAPRTSSADLRAGGAGPLSGPGRGPPTAAASPAPSFPGTKPPSIQSPVQFVQPQPTSFRKK